MRWREAVALALLLLACDAPLVAPDAGEDAGTWDAAPEPCSAEGTTECTPDGYAVRVCEGGSFRVITHCMREQGRLCEDAACVDPWRFGDPSFDACAGEPRGTIEALSEKAAYYDEIAARVHLHPTLRWLAPVRLRDGASEATATVDDVAQWHTGENDGLWSALYLASQAYRYAVTRDADALANLRVLMEGEAARMRITGVPGIFTRQMIPPDVPGIACPADPIEYVPDPEKDDNQWVRVGAGGCVEVVDGATMEWTTTTHCGLEEFAGWCFLDNVSKDEYAGHVFALGAVARLVDDVALRGLAADMLGQLADHLRDNALTLVDWDGRPTEHGRFYASAFDDFPGFNAAMALSFFATAAHATGRADLRGFYEQCLLQSGGVSACIDQPSERPRSYLDHLAAAGVYIGEEGCASNFNNISMHFLSLYGLLAYEREPARRERVQASLAGVVWAPEGMPRAAQHQHNAWFDFMWAAHKRLGPGSDGPALSAVRDGACMLRQFPASYAHREVPLPPSFTPYCTDRFGDAVSEHPREIADRCAATFVWWRDPYQLDESCADDPLRLEVPTGYLLAYWMGRYHGFLPDDG